MSDIPVIGIGASAGGLKEFERFFKNMPAGKKVAFVLIQHLAPDHKSILAEIVERYTEMDVFQVEDKVEIKAGKVYIIPPNKLLTIEKGRLLLSPMKKERGRDLPIDIFFRSLKKSLGEKAIAVILSGTGSDGTLGIKEVKEAGGLTIVQEPATADYDGMPVSAIKTGLIDFILPVEEMGETILSYVNNEFQEKNIIKVDDEAVQSEINQVFELIRKQIGHDFTNYKRNTILRRIERRITVNKFKTLGEYLDYLKENPKEISTLYKELLISVTSFYRDSKTFDFIEDELIPEIVSRCSNNIRIWVPACATGEEAYTWAISFLKYIEDNKLSYDLQVFASDIDLTALEKAREGYYTNNIVADVPEDVLERFFIKEKDGYRVKKTVRERIIFADQNLIQDPPYSKLNIISCRNLLIYLDNELQKKAIAVFHFALKKNAALVLGNSESLGNYAKYFKVINRKHKIFSKIENIDIPDRIWKINSPIKKTSDGNNKNVKVPISKVAKDFILDEYTPPSIVVDSEGEMVYVQGKTGKYLEIVTGDVHNNLGKVAKDGLKIVLMNGIRKVKKQGITVTQKSIKVKTNGNYENTDIVISPLKQNNEDTGLIIIVFKPSPTIRDQKTKEDKNFSEKNEIVELEKELAEKEETLQNTIEELETTNEELKSSNEEAQSTNEELQSTNEELQTSKEELQSVNEELTTTNNELNSKIEELSKANNDLKNLLNATDIATVFLDRNLKIFNFTPSISSVIELLNSDIGRSIKQFTNKLEYDHLVDNIKEVLSNLVPVEKEVMLRNSDEVLWMRIIPYITTEHVVEGVVITFTNITEKKKQEKELEEHRNHLEELVEQKTDELTRSEKRFQLVMKVTNDGIWDWDILKDHVFYSPSWLRILGIDEMDGNFEAWKIRVHEDDKEKIFGLLKDHLEGEIESWEVEHRLRTHSGDFAWVLAKGQVVSRNSKGKALRMVGSITDISQKKKAEIQIKKFNRELKKLNAEKEDFISVLAHDVKNPLGNIQSVSKLLIEDQDLNQKNLEELSALILQSAKKADKILKDTLLWLNPETKVLDRSPETTRVKAVMDEEIELMIDEARKKGIQIDNHVEKDLKVYINPSILKIVSRNLINNAIKFTKNSGSIAVDAGIKDYSLVVNISDNGIGMSQTEIDNLFNDELTRAKEGTNEETGTGLGLKICFKLLKKVGGKIAVESKENEGATFTFNIPVHESGD